MCLKLVTQSVAVHGRTVLQWKSSQIQTNFAITFDCCRMRHCRPVYIQFRPQFDRSLQLKSEI